MPGLLVLVFSLGILFARSASFSFWPLYLSALASSLLGVLYLKRGVICAIFIFSAAFFLGAALFNIRQPAPIPVYLKGGTNEAYIVKGFIETQPSVKNNSISFFFRSEVIQAERLAYPYRSRIAVILKGKPALHYGDALVLRGCLLPASNKDYFFRNGAGYVLKVSGEAEITRLGENKGFFLKKLAVFLKEKTGALISSHTSPITSAVLSAMVLGEKAGVPWFLNRAMMKTGTVHILVVSGFNVGIVSFIILVILKLMRIPRMARFLLAMPLLIIYCLVTGASNPVVRATIMAIFFLVAFLLQREPDIYSSCALAALFILLRNPNQLFDIGFQLSFASVLSIIYIYPKTRRLLRVGSCRIKPLRFMAEGCLVSFSAWLGTMGFIAYYFRIFSPVTVCANLFVVPIATLITLCGFSLVLMGAILPFLVPFFASSSELAVWLLVEINTLLLKLPGACLYLY